MIDRAAATTQLRSTVQTGTAPGRELRLEIKRIAEEARHERRTWFDLGVDPDLMNADSDAQRTVLSWIRILRLHAMDWTGSARCRRARISYCTTCTLLSYLCSVFMTRSAPSQNAIFTRRMIGWALASVVWIYVLANVFDLLPRTANLTALGDTVVVAVVAAVVATVFVTVPRFVQEAVELLPDDSPPFRPLWFDPLTRVRLRRRRGLLSKANAVLKLHDSRN